MSFRRGCPQVPAPVEVLWRRRRIRTAIDDRGGSFSIHRLFGFSPKAITHRRISTDMTLRLLSIPLIGLCTVTVAQPGGD
jgi:hypothetical protein